MRVFVRAARFLPIAAVLLGLWAGSAHALSPDRPRPMRLPEAGQTSPYNTILSDSGKYLAVLRGGLGGIRLYEIASGRRWEVVRNYSPNDSKILVSKSGRYVAYFFSPKNNGRGKIVRWDRRTGKSVAVVRDVLAVDIAMSSNGRFFAYWGTDRQLHRHDSKNQRTVDILSAASDSEIQYFENMAMSNDGGTVAFLVGKRDPAPGPVSGGPTRYCDLRVWHDDGRPSAVVTFDTAPEACAYSRDMAVSTDGRIVVVDPGDGPPYYRFDSTTGAAERISLPVPGGCALQTYQQEVGAYGTVSSDAQYMLVRTPIGCATTAFLWEIASGRSLINFKGGYGLGLAAGGKYAVMSVKDPQKQLIRSSDLALWVR